MKKLISILLITISLLSCNKDEEIPCKCFAVPLDLVQNKSEVVNSCAPLPESTDPCELSNIEAGFTLWVQKNQNAVKWLLNEQSFPGKGYIISKCPTAGLEEIKWVIRWNETFKGLFANNWSYDGKIIEINHRQYKVICETSNN